MHETQTQFKQNDIYHTLTDRACVCRFKRGTSQYLGMDDDDESEQAERLGPAASPDKAQVGVSPPVLFIQSNVQTQVFPEGT